MPKITPRNIEYFKQELLSIEKELMTLPEGHLRCRRNFIHYCPISKKEKGITKNTQLIKQLARKEFILARRSQIKNNLTQPLNKHDYRKPYELIDNLPQAYQDLPIDYFYHPSVEKWLAKPPRFNTLYQDNAKYTYNDISYRSLSEREIARKLDENGIPFYYDTRFSTGTEDISPDFQIKNPFNGKVFLWEFFGAFHITDYGQKMNDKMAAYRKINFIEGDNLIATFEHHLRDTSLIQEIIDTIIW